MNTPLVTISPDASLREAATLMIKNKVKRLPVISDEKLVGIITDTDLVSGSSLGLEDVLCDLVEMHRDSIHFQEGREVVRGICENCSQLSDSLINANKNCFAGAAETEISSISGSSHRDIPC